MRSEFDLISVDAVAVVLPLPEASLRAKVARTGAKLDPAIIFPTVEDGLKGMEFIEAAVKSSAKGSVWVKV
mgnify:CR=1 FL=1